MRTVTIAFRYKGTNYVMSRTFNTDEPLGYKPFEMFDEASEKLHASIKRMSDKRFTITGWGMWVGYCPR